VGGWGVRGDCWEREIVWFWGLDLKGGLGWIG
jgi:hypothetical protein